MHKKLKMLFLGTCLCGATFATDEKLVTLHGSIQIQARKDHSDLDPDGNNLQQFWGRGNFGASMSKGGYSGRVNIQAFPAGFGHELLHGATWDQDEEELGTSSTSIPNFQIEDAWMRYEKDDWGFQVGRFSRTTTRTFHFGNYLNQNAGGQFMSRVAYFNGFEVSHSSGILSSSIILAAGDKHLNTGSLRVYETVKIGENLNVSVGYFGNIFDRIQDSDIDINNRFSFVGDYSIKSDLKPYYEVGILQNHQEDSWDVPVLIGCQIPAGKYLNFLAVEFEYFKDRETELAMNIALMKRISAHTMFHLGFASSSRGEDFGKHEIALRYTGSF